MSNYKEDLPDTTETTCPECGEVTVRSRWYYGKGFCNRQCNTRYQNRKKTETRVTATCQGCQVEFWHWPSDTRKYCSRTCADRARDTRVTYKCVGCEREVVRYPKEHFYGKYCSSACQQRSMRPPGTPDTMSETEYQARLEQQGGVCAICGSTEGGLNRERTGPIKLAKDHCHKTGEWRGLLCRNCNLGLGLFKDDVELLLRAAEYLKNGGVLLNEETSINEV